MPNKPTYEELEQRIKELEYEVVKRKQAEVRLGYEVTSLVDTCEKAVQIP